MKKSSQDMRQHILDVARALMTHKGYTAVGLNEVLSAAGVPKGSFYHYFRSKEEFGEALLEEYFAAYLETIDGLLAGRKSGAEQLLAYLDYWVDSQCSLLVNDKCLVVKLGAEVCDLSDPMRLALKGGTQKVLERLLACVERGQADGSIASSQAPRVLAETLYQMWLGASLMAKVQKDPRPFRTAMEMSKHLLG